MATLLQRPPLAMFDPSLIHRNDEIFNPEPNGLGFFLPCIQAAIVRFKTRIWSKIVDLFAAHRGRKIVQFHSGGEKAQFSTLTA